jgi:hypothetical protein
MEKIQMLDLSKDKWKVLDKSVEEFENEYIRIIRPINDEAISIDCPECQRLLGEIEDIEAYKRHKMCKNCELDNWSKLYNK